MSDLVERTREYVVLSSHLHTADKVMIAELMAEIERLQAELADAEERASGGSVLKVLALRDEVVHLTAEVKQQAKTIDDLCGSVEQLRADLYQRTQERDAYRQESEAREGLILSLGYKLDQELLRSAGMKFKLIELENELRHGPSKLCTECYQPDCPGVVECPQCHVGEHGEDARTHIADHGYCRECLRRWQFGENEEKEEEPTIVSTVCNCEYCNDFRAKNEEDK